MPKINSFYNFTRDESGGRELRIEGDISESLWYGDECTPKAFRDELFADTGDITLYIHSNGGECTAASQIYTMLLEYKGNITVKIPAIAASAASVIAMAGTKVLMSPTARMVIHNPWLMAVGEKRDLIKAGEILDVVKETILNAYELRTGLSRVQLSHLMDAETHMDVNTCLKYGFCDGVIARAAPQDAPAKPAPATENKNTVKALYERLNLISGGYANV
jgi:ATP-dependent Clp protease protease subunit